jgi:hypothetical protein
MPRRTALLEWGLSRDGGDDEQLLKSFASAREKGVSELRERLTSLVGSELLEALSSDLGVGARLNGWSDQEVETVLLELWTGSLISRLLARADESLASQLPAPGRLSEAERGEGEFPLKTLKAWTCILAVLEARFGLAAHDTKQLWNLVYGQVDTLLVVLVDTLRFLVREKQGLNRVQQLAKEPKQKQKLASHYFPTGDTIEFVSIFFMVLAGAWSFIQASLLTIFTPQNCGGHVCTTNENLGGGEPLTRTNIAAVVVNFVTLAWLVLTLAICLWREYAIIQSFDVDPTFSADDLIDELEDYRVVKDKITTLNNAAFAVSLVMMFLLPANLILSASVILSPAYTLGSKSVTALVNQTMLLAPKASAWFLLSRKASVGGVTFATYIFASAPRVPTRVDTDVAFNPACGYQPQQKLAHSVTLSPLYAPAEDNAAV